MILGHSQAGKAHDLGSWMRKFESFCPNQLIHYGETAMTMF